MLKFRPERTHRRGLQGVLLVIALAVVASACAGRTMVGRLGSHPTALVGEWLDGSKSTATDSSIWVLGESGDDRVRQVRSAGESSERHYGYWFVQGELASTDRALCFTNRPGRSAPSCQSFDVDTVTVQGSARKRLIIHGYRGAHSVRDRVLLEHR